MSPGGEPAAGAAGPGAAPERAAPARRDGPWGAPPPGPRPARPLPCEPAESPRCRPPPCRAESTRCRPPPCCCCRCCPPAAAAAAAGLLGDRLRPWGERGEACGEVGTAEGSSCEEAHRAARTGCRKGSKCIPRDAAASPRHHCSQAAAAGAPRDACLRARPRPRTPRGGRGPALQAQRQGERTVRWRKSKGKACKARPAGLRIWLGGLRGCPDTHPRRILAPPCSLRGGGRHPAAPQGCGLQRRGIGSRAAAGVRAGHTRMRQPGASTCRLLLQAQGAAGCSCTVDGGIRLRMPHSHSTPDRCALPAGSP